jgi:integrase
MARGLHRLTALQVERAKKPGLVNDGGGLHLNVGKTGTKSWVFRYFINGRERRKGLGAYPAVNLGAARERAASCRRQQATGIDPLDADDKERDQAAKVVTFDVAAAAYLAAHRPGWRNRKHRQQWETTLATYASPTIGALDVAAVDRSHVLEILEPIWSTKNETGRRLRGRIEAVLDYAHVKGWRSSDANPARWKGNLRFALSAIRPKVRHHPALPYAELPAFFAVLQQQAGTAALALQFLILTAVRTGDIVGQGRDDSPPMRWSHVDFDQRLWVIPRTKNNTSHTVPLADAALAILARMRDQQGGGDGKSGDRNHAPDQRPSHQRNPASPPPDAVVFPSPNRPGEPLSNTALLALRKRMGRTDITTHGFRSCFRTWAEECTSFDDKVVMASMTHTIANKIRAAYMRGNFIDQRRDLMTKWAEFVCTDPAGKVVALPATGKRR